MPVAHLETVSMHYLWQGRPHVPDGGAPLVLIHGLATNLAFWMPLVQALGPDPSILLFDLRGHGRSSMPSTGYTVFQMAQDLLALMDQLKIDSAILVGHSFGGAIAAELAGHHPDRCSRLILADARLRQFQPSQRPLDWPQWPRLKEKLASMGLHLEDDQEEAGYHILTWLTRVRLQDDAVSERPRWMAELFGAGLSRPTAERWIRLMDTTSALNELVQPETVTHEQLAGLPSPVMTVYGERSPVLKTAGALSALWPQGLHHLVPEAGHFFPLSRAPELAGFIRDFMSRPPGRF